MSDGHLFCVLVWFPFTNVSLCGSMATMKKKTVAKRKTATKVLRNQSSEKGVYTYDTLVGEVEKDYKFTSSAPSNMKIGDFFKARGRHSLVQLLRGW